MACGSTDGLGAISAGCGMGCPPRPPTGRWLLTDRIDTTRTTINQQVTVRLNALPARDSIGRHAHVVGIYFQGTYRFTCADASTAAIPGYDVYAIWSQLWLQDASGWQYWAGQLDGRDIQDDNAVRRLHTSFRGQSSGLAVNAGMGTHDIDIGMYAQLSRFDFDKGPMVEGCIPLAALQAKTNALQFTVGTAGNGRSYTDVTNTGFQGDVNVWVDLVYRESLIIDEPWQLESYQVTGQSGSLRHGDRRHEYVLIRNKPEDTGGQELSDTGVQTWQCNGDTLFAGLSATEMTIRAYMIGSDQLGSTASDLATAMPADQSATIPSIVVQPYCHRRQDAPSGTMSFGVTTLGGHSAGLRYLHRTVACQSANRATQIALAAGCGMAAATQVQGVMPNSGCTCGMRTDLPIAIVPPHHAPGMSVYTSSLF